MFAAADVSSPQRCFVSELTPAAAGVCLDLSLQAAAPATPFWSVLSQHQPNHVCRLSGLSPLCFRCYLEIVVWEAVEWLPHQGTLSSKMCVWRFPALPAQVLSTARELSITVTWELHITYSHATRDLQLLSFWCSQRFAQLCHKH